MAFELPKFLTDEVSNLQIFKYSSSQIGVVPIFQIFDHSNFPIFSFLNFNFNYNFQSLYLPIIKDQAISKLQNIETININQAIF